MAIPRNRDELLAAIAGEYRKLGAELEKLPAECTQECSMEGHVKGSRMTPHNLLSYLLGWCELLLKWCEKSSRGEPVEFPESGFTWNQLGRLAEKFYRDYADTPFDELLRRLDFANAQVVALVEAHTQFELYERPWYGRWTLGRMIQLNTVAPYANGRTRLRRWQKERSRL